MILIVINNLFIIETLWRVFKTRNCQVAVVRCKIIRNLFSDYIQFQVVFHHSMKSSSKT